MLAFRPCAAIHVPVPMCLRCKIFSCCALKRRAGGVAEQEFEARLSADPSCLCATCTQPLTHHARVPWLCGAYAAVPSGSHADERYGALVFVLLTP